MKILITLDGSQLSEAILGEVMPIARAAQAEVHILRVCKYPSVAGSSTERALIEIGWTAYYYPVTPPVQPETYDEIVRGIREEAEEYLRLKASALGGLQVKTQVVMAHDVAKAIIDYALKEKVQIIAMSTHGRSGLAAALMGSVANEVVSSRAAPVLVMRPKAHVPAQPVLRG